MVIPLPPSLLAAAICAGLAGITGIVLMLTRRPVVPLERRRPGSAPPRSVLTRAADGLSGLVGKAMRRRDGRLASALTDAGVTTPARDIVILLACASLVAVAAGLLLGGPLLAVMLVPLPLLIGWIWLVAKRDGRRRKFGEQLDEATQLLAGSLRAGYSFNQALATCARESESPTAEEFSRINNEVRLGRPLGEALLASAERMKSVDFFWLAQAVAINREVGGNLADVLDNVGNTIRERAELHRRVRALAAEGKMSAWVLMALPVVVAIALSILNPGYFAGFTTSILGYAMLGAALILLIIGGLWLRAMITIKY